MTSSLCPAQREDHTSSYVTHPWSLCLEKHRGFLAFSSNTWQPNSLSLHTSNAGASICTSSGGLSPSPARGNALLTTGQLHPKKDSPRFFEHLIPFAHWELSKSHRLHSAVFHVKRNCSHFKISNPSKRHFSVNLRGKFVWLLFLLNPRTEMPPSSCLC